MQRTVRLKLSPLPGQHQVLSDTLQQVTGCFNAVVEYGWQHRDKNGVRLHRGTYFPLRIKYPQLPAQLVCAARVRATEALRSAFIRLRQGCKVSCPTSTLSPIRYDARTYRLLADDRIVSLATTAGRQRVPFKGNPHAASLLARAESFDSADLIARKGEFWLHVVLTLAAVPFKSNGNAVGVDLGLVRPAVASNNHFFGSRQWREIDRRYFRLRRSLQSKGTPSAKRHLRKLAGKVNRFRRDCDHVLSRRIVQSVTPGTTLVVENLVNIRSTTRQRGRESRRRLHSWSFAQLRSFLEYKTEEAGCTVSGVDPRHTSQACSRCGYAHRGNRRSRAIFRCRQCGFQLHADLNASRNIVRKYLAGAGISGPGGPPVNGPIVRELCSHSSTHKLPALAGGG